MLIVFSIWILWSICGALFAAYLFNIKPASSVNELSSNKFKVGLVLMISGPALIFAVFAIWVEDKISPFVRRFINWLLD